MERDREEGNRRGELRTRGKEDKQIPPSASVALILLQFLHHIAE